MMNSYLRELKEAAGNPTNAEIAEKSGVPESTIAKMMSGNVDNPRFQSVVDVVIALNGSLDELVGIVKEQPDSVVIDNPIEAVEKVLRAEETTLAHTLPDEERRSYIDQIQRISNEAAAREERLRQEAHQREVELRAEYAAREARMEDEFARREKRSHLREIILFSTNCVQMLFIMTVLLIDLSNPNMGYFRYAASLLPNVEGFADWWKKMIV